MGYVLQMYLREPKLEKCGDCPMDDCALKWWKGKAAKYPIISQLARKLLAIPASSTPSERVFSAAGNIVTKKRSCLSADHVDALVTLAMNYKV